jgi:hypothetical protein
MYRVIEKRCQEKNASQDRDDESHSTVMTKKFQVNCAIKVCLIADRQQKPRGTRGNTRACELLELRAIAGSHL